MNSHNTEDLICTMRHQRKTEKRATRLLFLLVAIVLFTGFAFGQNKFTLSGTIKDKSNGEQLTGTSIGVKELPTIGTTANEYGFYSLTLPKGNYTVIYRYLGYDNDTVKITLDRSIKIDKSLAVTSTQVKEVIISTRRKDENIRSAQSGIARIDPKEVSKLPVLFGERDLVKSIQLLPGVKNAGEGNSGFYVRGGTGDQNLILLDEAPVYNASHLLGFFSTFNSDAIRDVTLYKGTQPSQYGGRLSSVLDMKMDEGNNQKYEVAGGVGLISSRLSVQGPIVKDKGSFLITGRRTYADMFLLLSKDETIKNSSLYFYDVNMKANYNISEKDRLYLSGYFGRDKLGVGKTFGIDWGNATGTLRWNHIINDKLFSNTSVIYSNYSYNIDINTGGDKFGILSEIQDYNLKQEFQYFANPNYSLRFGFNSIYHELVPGKITGSSNINLHFQNRQGWENAVYINNDIKLNDKLNINAGLRLSAFSVLGKGDFYTLNASKEITDTTTYQTGDIIKTYYNLEPRLDINYRLDASSSVKAGYFRNTQNMHLISNSTSSSPTDKWVTNSNIIKPEIADQVSLGYFKNFADNMYEFSVEGYYKNMQNQIDYKDGANVQSTEVIETQLLFGKGRAYGLEFLIKKKEGRFTGWAGYTLSRTEKQIDGINFNKWYAAKQDRTHDITLVAMYDLTERWSVSALWTFYTGNAVSFPSGKYKIDDVLYWNYTERNGYRMPNYHRLDLGATYKLKDKPTYSSDLTFSLYNAYGRENAYSIDFQESESDPNKTEVIQTALFRFIPSISWNFHFK